MTKNLIFHRITKSIEIHHHFIHGEVAAGLIKTKFCSTKYHVDDGPTTALNYPYFLKFPESFGITTFPSRGSVVDRWLLSM